MKLRFVIALGISAVLFFLTSRTARADLVFTVDLNTTPLTTSPGDGAGPFSLFFDMIQGDPANTTNTATVGDFSFGGGSAGACPASCAVSGDESGDATGTINLSTSDGFEGLIQSFTPGTGLSFTVDLTTNPSATTPDTFQFSILDATDFPIPTEDPSGADSLLTVFLDSTSPAVLTYASDPTTGTNAGDVSITMGAPSIGTPPTSAVPEPSELGLLGIASLVLAAVRFSRRVQVGQEALGNPARPSRTPST